MEAKADIKLSFTSAFPEEDKDKVLSLFKDKLMIDYSPQEVMIRKDIGVWVAVGITVLTASGLKKFVDGFCEEAGKQLARKLFESSPEVNIMTEDDPLGKLAKNEEQLCEIAKELKVKHRQL